LAAQEPTSIELRISGPIDRADIPGLCVRARDILEAADVDRLVCDVEHIPIPDAVTVDALARLQLTVRRVGRDMRLEHAPPELLDLLAFMGLSEAINPRG
jgi:ABC-type transporter Mla MlaB component